MLSKREMYLKLVDAKDIKSHYTAEQLEQIRYPRFRNILRDEMCPECNTNFMIDQETGFKECITCHTFYEVKEVVNA